MAELPTASALVNSYQYVSETNLETSQIPLRLIEHISNKSITLLGIVKLLGPALTSEDDEKRARGAESSR